MSIIKKLFIGTALLTTTLSITAEGLWPSNPVDGQKTDPIGGTIYIWRADEMAWEEWDVTLPTKGGTGLESPTKDQVMVTNGQNPMEVISYSTLKARMGLDDAGNITGGHLPLSVMPATTDRSLLIGTGTGMEEITAPNLKALMSLNNVTNVDSTNADTIISGTLNSERLPVLPLAKFPAITDDSIIVGTGAAVEEQTPAQFKLTLSLDKVPNFDLALQAEAEAGTANNKFMTPLLTNYAIDSQRAFATQAEVEAGTVTNKVVSPATLKSKLIGLDRFGTATERNALPIVERTPGLRWYDTTTDRYYYINSSLQWMVM